MIGFNRVVDALDKDIPRWKEATFNCLPSEVVSNTGLHEFVLHLIHEAYDGVEEFADPSRRTDEHITSVVCAHVDANFQGWSPKEIHRFYLTDIRKRMKAAV